VVYAALSALVGLEVNGTIFVAIVIDHLAS